MKNRFLTIFICIFIAVVLVAGGCFGLAVGLNNARAVVVCGGVTADEGTLNYLASYYKMLYIRSLKTAGIDASDTESFWNSKSEEGVAWGEHFRESYRDYVASLTAAANIYVTQSGYTAEDKIRVGETCDEILKYKAKGSVDVFNDTAESYGFDFEDFQNAAAILYKAGRAREIIYGSNGENMSNFPELCEEYLKEYSHVSLLFVKRSGDLTEDKLKEKQEKIILLTDAIEAKKNGGDLQINPTMFEYHLKTSDGDPEMFERGYYFHPNAEKTAEFAEALPEVVKMSLEMNKNDFARVDYSDGVCFIYKYDVVDSA